MKFSEAKKTCNKLQRDQKAKLVLELMEQLGWMPITVLHPEDMTLYLEGEDLKDVQSVSSETLYKAFEYALEGYDDDCHEVQNLWNAVAERVQENLAAWGER